MATRAPDHPPPPAAGPDMGLDVTHRRLATLLARGAVRAAACGALCEVISPDVPHLDTTHSDRDETTSNKNTAITGRRILSTAGKKSV